MTTPSTFALPGIGLYNYLKFKMLTQSSSSSGSRTPRGYAHLSTSDDPNLPSHSVLFDSDQGASGGAGRMSQRENEPILTEEEKERRRKIEEEASMDGWETSGAVRTGQGWDDGDDDDYR